MGAADLVWAAPQGSQTFGGPIASVELRIGIC